MKNIVRLLIVTLALATSAACTRIGPGYVGVKVSNAGTDRGVNKDALTTGWVVYMPGATSVFEYPTFVQQVTLAKVEGGQNDEISFSNSDQMTIYADISFAYHLERDKVPAFYEKFRNDNLDAFTHGYLKSLIRDKFTEVGGRYRIEQIMGDNGPFLREVREAVQKEVSPFGVVMETQFGFVGALRPPASVIASINAKAQAQQLALQKEMELKQAEADARKQVAEADGHAKSKIARANADAETIRLLSEAQAAANKRLQDSLTPSLVEYTKIQKWNGTLPTFMGAGTPLITFKDKE